MWEDLIQTSYLLRMRTTPNTRNAKEIHLLFSLWYIYISSSKLISEAMALINKVLTLWTICCILLFSQMSQSNGIIINNWLIVLIPMCFVDFILLITSILFMSGRLPQIFGDCDAGSKLNRTLIFSQVAVILWSLCYLVLYSQISKFSETIYYNWCITIALMWFLDIILLMGIRLIISGRLTQILGYHDVGRRFSRTATFSVILWKLSVQTVLWVYLKENIGGPPYDQYQLSSRFIQTQPSSQKDIPERYRSIFAVFPLWTTIIICLLAACSQIVNFNMSSLWAFSANE
ncbi:unnamed protein product [Trichobilharzia szidati]|nr:unnamed protein product [Trichobilharzia szidati]